MTRRVRIDDLTALEIPAEPALSPDGSRIVYVLRTADEEADRDTRALWQVPAAGGEARRLTRGPGDAAPAWSPDGRRIAFVRAQDGPGQVWLLPADGGEPEQVTTLPLGAGSPVWRPDGGALAFSAPVDSAAEPGEDDPARATVPVVAGRLEYKADGAGLLRTVRSHLHVLDVATGEVRQVTSGDWNAGTPAWSPDGSLLAFSAALDPRADLTLRSAAYVLDQADRLAEPRLVGSDEGVAGAVTWTADGSALLVVGRADPRPGHAGLLRVPLDGGETTDLAASLDRNVMPGGPAYPGGLPQLTGDGRTVLFCVRDRGCTHLYAVDVEGGAPRLVAGGAGTTVAGLSVVGDTAALTLATPTSYGEVAIVATVAGGKVEVRTRHSLADVELFAHEEREFTVSDGTVVQGWLLRDPARTGPLPLLLDIHGGPHNAWNATADAVHLYHQELAGRGWAVLLLNPRGSDGYGEAFFTAGVGGWGTADARDFLEPLDQLVAEGTADAERLAVAGYSYGGFMTCYLTSRDDRFAAAVAGGVVSDLVSMAGTSDAGHYLDVAELGGADAANSPLAQVGQVRTPTLVVHGAEDDRCPVGQAEQWFSALREREVPTRLVLYPGASHLFIVDGKPSHRMDFNRRVLGWVEQYAAGRPVIDAAHWRRRLAELARKHRVPGAALGILRLDEEQPVVTSFGVLSKATGVEVTGDSLFQIGSISKVWTTTVIMQLVSEGLLDLDAPVTDVLPELVLADPEAAKGVTTRHLVTHTSGIDGDVFTDTGRGDDCVEKYTGRLGEVTQNHPLGATFSYCNSGFVLAGRVIEKLTGKTWDAAVRERLFAPLGLAHTVTLPEEALLFRAAVGHIATGDEEPRPTPVWTLPRSMGPAGLISASAADVLAFARLHLTGGLGPDGARVLAADQAAAMTEKEVDLPDKATLGDSWGLGWIRFLWDGQLVVGHDGGTIGQSAFLRLLPEQGLAVTLLTNGGDTAGLYRELFGEIFGELAGIRPSGLPEPSAVPPEVDLRPHLGVYERASVRTEVLEGEDGARLRLTLSGPLAELDPDPVTEYELIPLDDTRFVYRAPGASAWTPVVFYTLATGERYVHFGARAAPKVS
ncbi:serine hydrolase [Amycolatopsis jiangsuensis]|uniref:Dipeptidyl aminopeptidase/acylaminoacyl peptidase n=1 Tax=Amycolatopsis jiangsuensis TaxID=1181879 RepID=A0A840IN52_9PSEU|nr:serine hydrolase [Amycolatopsis jiangsuensis]MBB4682885.1 dipeptidyl aminopeptidase/acylaminoacyl peptidase [Amycolatopsis jiangsuensis]